MSLFIRIIIFIILALWFFICLLLAFIGIPLKKNKLPLENTQVIESSTVCKILNQKKILSDEDYQFETNQVAPRYDQNTFAGYLLIMTPVIWILKKTNHLDSSLIFFVNRWINVHRYKLNNISKVSAYHEKIVEICVFIAHNVGKTLILIWLK